MSFCTVFLAAALAWAPGSPSGSGESYRSFPSPPYERTPAYEIMEQINLQHSAQLKALHDEGVAIRRQDGGILTPAHHAELQAKLDRIQASYRRAIHREDPHAVDAKGMRLGRY